MEFNEYQKEAIKTVCYDDSIGPYYSVLGLCGEAGEVADKLKKIYRDKDWKNIEEDDRQAIRKELGDVLWYVAKMCDDLGFDLESVATCNLNKINKRKETNTLHGEGDNREVTQRKVDPDILKKGDHVELLTNDCYFESTGVVEDLYFDIYGNLRFSVSLDEGGEVWVCGLNKFQKIDV